MYKGSDTFSFLTIFIQKKPLLYDCRHECGLNTDHITLAAVSLAPLPTLPTNHYLQPPAMPALNATKSLCAYVRHRIRSDPFCLTPLHNCLERETKRWGTADVISQSRDRAHEEELMTHKALFFFIRRGGM